MNSGDVLRTETKVIDNDKFECTIFPGLQGLRLKGRLLKFIGPGIGKAFKGVSFEKGKSVLDNDIDLSVVGQAIEGLVEQLDNESVIQLILDLLSFTRMNGQSIDKNIINMKFAGEYTKLYKAIFFVIDANRFFGKWSIGEVFDRIEIPATPNTPTQSTDR